MTTTTPATITVPAHELYRALRLHTDAPAWVGPDRDNDIALSAQDGRLTIASSPFGSASLRSVTEVSGGGLAAQLDNAQTCALLALLADRDRQEDGPMTLRCTSHVWDPSGWRRTLVLTSAFGTDMLTIHGVGADFQFPPLRGLEPSAAAETVPLGPDHISVLYAMEVASASDICVSAAHRRGLPVSVMRSVNADIVAVLH